MSQIDDQQVIRLLINAASIEKIFVSPSRSKADETARSLRGQQATFWTADMFRVNTTLYVQTIDKLAVFPGCRRLSSISVLQRRRSIE